MKKSIFLLLLPFVLTGCSTAHKFQAVEIGMSVEQVTEDLGSPEKISQTAQSDEKQYYYVLREDPYKVALGACVLLPVVIPTLGVMWFSDGCLGEQSDYRIEFKNQRVIKKEKLEKSHPY